MKNQVETFLKIEKDKLDSEKLVI